MDAFEDANRCIKYLYQSVLEGRYRNVEKVALYLLVCDWFNEVVRLFFNIQKTLYQLC